MKALVVGAGIGGLTAAVALRRAGIEVELYERAPQLRAAGTGLSIMSNAVAALRSCDVDLDGGQSIETFELLTSTGRPIRTVPLKEITDRLGVPSVCIHRAELQQELLLAAGDCPIMLGANAFRYGYDKRGVRLWLADGRVARGDVLIGADGLHSAVRRQLAGPQAPREAGYGCWLAVIPFRHDRVTPGYVGHYWGRGKRFGLIDLGGGRVYWWGTRNGGLDDPLRSYRGWAEEVQAAVAATPPEAITTVSAMDRPPLPSWGDGPVTLLGDAAHPMLTSLGQGAGMAIEDAVVLARTLAGAADPCQALRSYEAQRRARTRRMVRVSRLLSKVEQASLPWTAALRDAVFRWMPRPMLVRQNESALVFPSPGAHHADTH
ncbi:FAD-dependent monooxygenase [Actinocrispum sp. NPDC049592]|uniref:FAD-dependent monooxygenase n=1 Tax=Actinocrispum sp. NPDC049592 TaxID=3154835 RepID=UPI00342F8828